ncbi:MAG: YraN family protein [Spirochaetota bacterium]
MHGSDLPRVELGRRGEDAAAALLESEGYHILSRNFRMKTGEIDLIAEKTGIVCFVEVKNWSVFGAEDLSRAISSRKRHRIVETSKIFLSRNREYSSAQVRYDVLLLRDGTVVRRFESAFTGES